MWEKLPDVLRSTGKQGLHPALFLGLHLFNVIWIERRDAIQASARNEQVLHQLMNEIERVSRVTVNAAMVSWKKWPERLLKKEWYSDDRCQ